MTVAPYAGAWIEMFCAGQYGDLINVAPYAGAWIEMIVLQTATRNMTSSLPTRERGLKSIHFTLSPLARSSLPTRERGLKSLPAVLADNILPVAPYAGAWIEIWISGGCVKSIGVAPYAGAWIEISIHCTFSPLARSLPTRERGLKFLYSALLGSGGSL